MDNIISKVVQDWINEYIIKMNLCPYAQKAMQQMQLKIVTTKSEQFHLALHQTKLLFLEDGNLSTTLIALEDEITFEQLLNLYEFTLDQIIDWTAQFQVVPFHPEYMHQDHDIEDVANFTNCSPVPIIQLILFSDIKKYHNPLDTEVILRNNQTTLESVGLDNLQKKVDELKTKN